MKKYLLFVLLLLFITTVSAGFGFDKINIGVFKQNDCIELKQTCSSCSYINFTRVSYPNGSRAMSNIESNKEMYNYNYIFCDSTKLGKYIVEGVGDINGTDSVFIYFFDVTSTGKEFNNSKAILYIGLLGIFLFILFSTFFGMGYLPSSNQRDEFGKILSVNYLKYLRLPLWVFSYFLFTAIIFLSSNIAMAYLEEEMFGKLLFAIFSILMALSPIIIIVLVISFFIGFFHDREFQRMLNRGMFPGGNL
jgi:hypothetical protein